jgi:hypothetical protein
MDLLPCRKFVATSADDVGFLAVYLSNNCSTNFVAFVVARDDSNSHSDSSYVMSSHYLTHERHVVMISYLYYTMFPKRHHK